MTIKLAPPPLQVPGDFLTDKTKSSFFSGLINTIYQLWNATYALRSQVKIKTTDATVTGLVRIPIANDTTMMVTAHIVARRTGGTSGSNGDSAWYVLTGAYKNINGVLTGLGVAYLLAGEDQAGWAVAFSTCWENIVVVVTGASGNNITWEGMVSTYVVGA